MSYGRLLRNPVDEISGDTQIDLENLPAQIKQAIFQRVQNGFDRDVAQGSCLKLLDR